jgi:hypothetical protein
MGSGSVFDGEGWPSRSSWWMLEWEESANKIFNGPSEPAQVGPVENRRAQ